jgi:hypothetical protein
MTSGPVRYRLTVLTEVVQVLQGVRLRRTGHRELDSDRELGRDTRVAAGPRKCLAASAVILRLAWTRSRPVPERSGGDARLIGWPRVGSGGRYRRRDAHGAYQSIGVPVVKEINDKVAESAKAITNGEEADCKELQDALLSTKSVEQFLHEMAVLAAGLVSGGLSCGMTMRSNGRPVTVACSDPVAARIDEVQYQLDDGPCLQAMRDGHMVRIEDTARSTGEARWPEFEARAASDGIRSCLALPLNSGGKSVGALNLYARTASAFGATEARRAENFAENASGALALATRLASDATLIEQLRSSLTSRTVIDQALGIIMAREECTQTRAFAILRTASQNSNIKLRDVATAIVTSVTGEPPQPPPPLEEP